MRRVCAWCGKHLGFKCPHCGHSLTIIDNPRGEGKVLACVAYGLTSKTTIVFGPQVAREWQTTHGICTDCANREAFNAKHQPEMTLEDIANLHAYLTQPPAPVDVDHDDEPEHPQDGDDQ